MLTLGVFDRRDRALVEAADRSQAIVEFDLEGIVRAANRNFLQMVGYDSEEICGKKHSIFVDAAEAREPAYQAFWKDLAQGVCRTAAVRLIGKASRELWIQATYSPVLGRGGKPVGVTMFATDITQS